MYYISDNETAIKDIQRMLIGIDGDTAPPESGKYDDKTRDAIKALQKRNGLTADGVTDLFTFEALRREYDDREVRVKGKEQIPGLALPIDQGSFGRGISGVNTALAYMMDYYGYSHSIRYNDLYGKASADAAKILRVIYMLKPGEQMDEELLYYLYSDYRAVLRYSGEYPV